MSATKLDDAVSAIFAKYKGREVAIIVRIDGKEVQRWTERDINASDADAVRVWLEGA